MLGLSVDGGVLTEDLGEGGWSKFATHGVLSSELGAVDSAELMGTEGAAVENAAIEFDRIRDGFDDIEKAALAGGRASRTRTGVPSSTPGVHITV